MPFEFLRDKESFNFTNYCRRQGFGAVSKAGFFWLQRTAKAGLGRLPGVVRAYPKEIKTAHGDLAKQRRAQNQHQSLVIQDFNFSADCNKLRLAGGSYRFHGRPSWTECFDDPEQTHSLHRWNWLLTQLTDEPFPEIRAWGLWLMRDWLKVMGDNKKNPAWSTYTTGERISNGILFLNLAPPQINGHEKITYPQDLIHAFLLKAQWVADHLEYNGVFGTGNHTINNARALYFAGQTLENRSLSRLAGAILRHDLAGLAHDGFLREGSSHYHFLVTRWLLEIMWLAQRTNDFQMTAFLQPLVQLMAKRCLFFMVYNAPKDKWLMPLIGDLSPDFPWEWLIDLPFSSLALNLLQPAALPGGKARPKNWAGLFNEPIAEAYATDVVPAKKFFDFQAHKAGGWYRLDLEPVTIFWHIQPSTLEKYPTHAHCDIGSFCLYWNNFEILIDPGRLNYRLDHALGAYGASAGAHNTITIDGLEPFVIRNKSWYPSFYRETKIETEWKTQPQYFEFNLYFNGFWRLNRPVAWHRIFRVHKDKIIIDDHLEGSSRHQIESRFHWAPELKISPTNASPSDAFLIAGPDIGFKGTWQFKTLEPSEEALTPKMQLLKAIKGPPPAGWHCPNYGEIAQTTTLALQCQTALPLRWRYTLRWE